VDKTLGVTADLASMSDADRDAALQGMEAAGFRWLRQRFDWAAIGSEQGTYDWEAWDSIVADAARHNLGLVAVLDGSPAWARATVDAENRLAPPEDVRDFGDWAAALAARYGPEIDYYQVWDEPNIAPHWGDREVDPAAYVRLLREAAIRIRAADPGAVVVAAALAPNVEAGGANMSELLYLEGMYAQGAAPWFEVIAAQPYSFGQPLDAPPDPRQLNWQRVALLQEVADRHGDPDSAVWAVSWGLAQPTTSLMDRAVEQARRDWPWLGPMLWAAWAPSESHGEYALVDAENAPQAAYYALQELAERSPVAWPGVYLPDHEAGQYEGEWQVTAGGADIGASGDRLVIPFYGTRLDLRVRRGDYRAFLFVTIDGQPANGLPRDAQGRAYVVLYDPLHGEESVTLAHNLPGGEHRAEIVAERGWSQWAIAGWDVAWQEGSGAPWVGALVALAALPVLGVLVYAGWPQRLRLQDTARGLVSRYDALPVPSVLILTGATAALLYIVVGTLPSLAVLALLAVLLLLRPAAGLPLVTLSLPFYQVGKPLLGKVFSMTEILLLLTAAGWLAGIGLRRLLEARGSGHVNAAGREGAGRSRWLLLAVRGLSALDWGVVALVVVGLLSLLWAEHTRVAAREFRTVVLEGAVFYALLRVLVSSRRHAWQVVDAWVLGGTLIAAVGLAQWALGENLISAEGVWRVRGFYGSPNNLALYLGRVLPLTLAAAGWMTGQQRRRWLYALGALIIGAALFLTYSRGAWLVGVPASLLFLGVVRGRRVAAIAVAALVLVGAILLLVAGVGRLTSLLDASQGTTFFRLQLWRSSWGMIRDHPVLGVGLDNFLYFYRSHYVLPTAWEEFNLSHPHNLVLDAWLRLGLPGLVTMAWLLLAFFRRGWHLYQRLPETSERLLVLGLLAGMVNFAAHGLVDNAFFLVDLAFVFMLMLGLIAIPIWEARLEPATTDQALAA
ncbi:MAG: O-antigen ligase family protein, partial [Anaerolineae bacterium]|nr:O-antigen ligase family protein [Anaerolineae bacterium]